MDKTDTFAFEWPYILSMLPEVDESAATFGAIRRRRGVRSAENLLRLAMVYGYCDYSLRQTAAWAASVDIADVSDVALLKRFRQCPRWLGHLVATKIAERTNWQSPHTQNLRLRLVDGSSLSAPGSKGIDWRIHLGFDLERMAIDQIEITDVRGAERLDRFALTANELVIADRGYAHAAQMCAVARQGAFFLVRLPWRNVPMERDDGQPWDVMAFLRSLPEAASGHADVWLRDGEQRLACRVLAVRKTEAAAACARKKAIREYGGKRKTMDPRTLEAAGYTFLLTNASPSALSAEAALELYRYRWQVELAFKRLKSVLDIDRLRAKEPAMAQTYLLAKMLGALLIEDMTERYLAFFPWGYPLRHPGARVPVAAASRFS
jgi:hypothetical protein